MPPWLRSGVLRKPEYPEQIKTHKYMHEIKLKDRSKDKFDVILTGITAKDNEGAAQQAANISLWGCGAMVYVVTDIQFVDGHIRTTPPKDKDEPTVKEVFGQFMLNTPGNRVVAICDPDTVLGTDAEPLFKWVDKSGMQLAWGGYAGTPWPKLFIMSAQVIHYFFRNIPPNLKFSDSQWRVWLDNWLNLNLQSHRYFNVNDYGLVIEEVPKTLTEALPSPSDALSPQVDTKVAKRRPGRPKRLKTS